MPNTYKKHGEDYKLSTTMLTLPREYYQSESIYNEELEKIFYKRWLFVCREEEIPNPGDFLTVTIGDESIIIVRDAPKKIRAHFNVCRHRGNGSSNQQVWRLEIFRIANRIQVGI